MIQLNLQSRQMHQVLNKITKVFLLIVCITSLCSCKETSYIKTYDYLVKLALDTGVCIEDDKDTVLTSLEEYGVYNSNDNELLNKNLTYGYMLDSFSVFTEEKVLKDEYDREKFVNAEYALKAISALVKIINNQQFETNEYHTYSENVKNNLNGLQIGDIYYDKEDRKYKKVVNISENIVETENASFEEVFEEIRISSSNEIDFDNSIIVDDDSPIEEVEYDSLNFELLSSKRHVINKNGYRISYKVSSGIIDFRVSKDGKYNSYIDFTLSNVKPSYKWDYKHGKVNEAYFRIDYKLSGEIGASKSKKKSLKLDLSKIENDSLLSSIKNAVSSPSKDVDATIKICSIKTPIPSLPLVYFNIDVIARMYVNGKVDIVLSMDNTSGFEIVNNKFRLINDGKQDIDFNVEASARAVAGLNFNIEAANFRLMDLEVTGGAKASIKPILHLYDSDGSISSNTINLDYSELQDIVDKNDKVKLCADVSLNWVLDIDMNTSKTLLYKIGLSRSKEILNKNDQILGNMTHLENGHFVKSCTRKSRKNKANDAGDIKTDKILLDKYSIALNVGKVTEMPIKALPNGYSYDDLVINVENEEIAEVKNMQIIGKNVGSTKIDIKTNDNKYLASINILISTG